jgi:hypothetical protein
MDCNYQTHVGHQLRDIVNIGASGSASADISLLTERLLDFQGSIFVELVRIQFLFNVLTEQTRYDEYTG